MTRRILVVIAALWLVALALSACAPGANPLENTPAENGTVANFWLGLWHGIISPVTFIISLFRPDVRFYEVHNDGIPYNVGFAIGALLIVGGGGSGASRGRS